MQYKYLSYSILLLVVWSCRTGHMHAPEERLFKDVLGREVWVPDTIQSVIPLRESTMRLISYVKASDKVVGIEDVEIRGVAFTHIFAHPKLKKCPIIGPLYGGDPELILAQKPDVIITSNISATEANALQTRLNIPVIVIQYGNLSNLRSNFFSGLRMLGDLLHRQQQADTLIRFIEQEITDLQKRTQCQLRKEAYLGGISYQGRHNIVSTDPHYAPFVMSSVENTARQIDSSLIPVLANTTIDLETLIAWNPETLFIDQGGFMLVKEDFQRFPALTFLLNAYKQHKIYILWPYYMYHSNFEVMLINAWSVGKTMYPEKFQDIDLREKTDTILKEFVGKPVTDSLIRQWGWFRNITDEL